VEDRGWRNWTNGGDTYIAVKEDIDSLTYRVRKCDHPVRRGLAPQDTYEVGEVVEDREVMFHDYDVVVVSGERSDNSGSGKTLFYVEIRGRFVEHVTGKG
jgi:hypothetical protein